VRTTSIKLAGAVLDQAIDADGGLLYEGNPRDGITNTNKEWWPQAEGMMGFLHVYRISGEICYLKAACQLWDFIESRLIDNVHGEWHYATDQSGAPDTASPKISFWRCPYHNGRSLLFAPDLLREAADSLET
jgi:mannobiose 2-epimerase